MKKSNLFWGLSLLAVVATGCSNEEVLNNAETNEPINALTVSVEDMKADSRIGFDKGGKFFWSEGDKLTVKMTNGENVTSAQFGIDSKVEGTGAGHATARFTTLLDPEDKISDVAAYPNATFSGGNVTINYPAVYNDVKIDTDRPVGDEGADKLKDYKNFHAVMAGKIADNAVTLKHLGGYFLIRVDNMPVEAGSFVFETKDQKISGDFSILESELANNANFTTTASSTENTVTINFTGAPLHNSAYYYIPVPVGTYSEVTVTLKDTQSAVQMSASKSNVEIVRGGTKALVLSSFSGQ